MSAAGVAPGADGIGLVAAPSDAVDAAAAAVAMPPPPPPPPPPQGEVGEAKAGEVENGANAPGDQPAPQNAPPAAAAAAVAVEPQAMTAQIPAGIAPGQPFGVDVGGERIVQVTCPAGAVAGSRVQFLVPTAAALPGAAAAPLAAELWVPPVVPQAAAVAAVAAPLAAAAAAPRLVAVTVPAGISAGQRFTVTLGDGRQIPVICPAGLGAGANVQFPEPANPAAAATAAAAAHQPPPQHGLPHGSGGQPPPFSALGQGGYVPPPLFPVGGHFDLQQQQQQQQQRQQMQQHQQRHQQWLDEAPQRQYDWPHQPPGPRAAAPPFGNGARLQDALAHGPPQHAHGQAHAGGQGGMRAALSSALGGAGFGGLGDQSGGAQMGEFLATLKRIEAAACSGAKDTGPVSELQGILALPFQEKVPVHRIDEVDFRCTGCANAAGAPGGFGDCEQCTSEARGNPSITARFSVWLKHNKAQPVFPAQAHDHEETRDAIKALQVPSSYHGDYGDAKTLPSADKRRLAKRVDTRTKKQTAAFEVELALFPKSKGQSGRATTAKRAIADAAETNALNQVLKLCVSELAALVAELRQRGGGGSSSSSSSSSSSGGANSSGNDALADRLSFVARNIKVVKALFHQGTLENELVVHRVLAREYFARHLPTVLGAARAMDLFEDAARGGTRTGAAGCADTPLIEQVRASIVERVQRMKLPQPSADELKDRDVAGASMMFNMLHDTRGSLLGKRSRDGAEP